MILQEAWEFLTTADNWSGRRGIIHLTWNHVRLSAFAVLVASVIAMPPALWLGHIRRGGLVAVSTVNISRAIPSFAVIALVLPFSLSWGFGLGFWPTFVALFLLAMPPIFANTYTGIREVPAATVEAANGMGMRSWEVLRRVEVPAALPLIMTGLRVSAVQVVATATLGALVGFDCLGSLIIQAIAEQDDGKLLASAALVGALALLTDAAFGLAQRRMTPWVPRTTRKGRARDVSLGPAGG